MSAGPSRWTHDRPCPICGGWQTAPRGRGVRCWGFHSADGRVAFCVRIDSGRWSDGASAWAHNLIGDCSCGQIHGYGHAAPIPTPKPEPERQTLNADTLDLIYRRYLELCPLETDHCKHLFSRGEPDLAAAIEHGYGSLPRGYNAARQLVNRLCGDFGRDIMALVPGFYRNKRDGRLITHTAIATYDAIVLPGPDEANHITSLHRMTTRDTKGTHGKYMPFLGTSGAFSVVGSFPAEGPREVRHVEGLHKMYVAQLLKPDALYLGTPGTSVPDGAITTLKRLNPDVVTECLDADKWSNPDVARATEAEHRKLVAAGFSVETAVWEPADGKGLDDLLAAGHTFRRRTVARAPAVGARKPYAIPEPGPVPAGRPLDVVQRESAQRIDDFLSHRRKNVNKALVNAAPAGTGKSTAAVETVLQRRIAGRFVVSTIARAEEMQERTGGRVRAVRGITKENCKQFPLVEAARERDLDVTETICKTCPFAIECRIQPGMYKEQFKHGG